MGASQVPAIGGVSAANTVQPNGGGQFAAKRLPEEGIKHIFQWAWICREVRKVRLVYPPRPYPL